MHKASMGNSLDVIIDCNMKLANYFDVTFNPNNSAYRLLQKTDNIIQYMPVESKHPLNIIKQISKTIEKDLS